RQPGGDGRTVPRQRRRRLPLRPRRGGGRSPGRAPRRRHRDRRLPSFQGRRRLPPRSAEGRGAPAPRLRRPPLPRRRRGAAPRGHPRDGPGWGEAPPAMIPPLGRLILAWLTTRPDGGPLSDLKKALARYAPAGVPEAVDELRAGGLVAVTRGRVRATDAGRAAGEGPPGGKPAPAGGAAGGRTQPPPRPPGPGPGAAPRHAAAAAEGLGGAATQAQGGLPRGLPLARTADALGWKLLGGTPGEPFTRERVLAFLVGRALGARVPDVAAAMRLAAARAAGARRA